MNPSVVASTAAVSAASAAFAATGSAPFAVGALGLTGLAGDIACRAIGGGRSVTTWGQATGTAVRELLRSRDDLRGPDGTSVDVERWEPITVNGADGIRGDVVAGRNLDDLTSYVATGLAADVNRVLRRRIITQGKQAATVLCHLQPSADVPGHAVLYAMREDPLWALMPWPWAPGETPITSPTDPLPFGMTRFDGEASITLGHGPHWLISGRSGSGKSVTLQTLICHLAAINRRQRNVVMIGLDMKGGMEVGCWAACLNALAWTPADARPILERLLNYTHARASRYRSAGMRSAPEPTTDDPLVVVFVDELAILMSDGDCARMMTELAQIGRAVGVHLVCCTQYGLAQKLGSDFLVNVGGRVSHRLASLVQAQVALADDGNLSKEVGPQRIPQKDPRARGVSMMVGDGVALQTQKTFWIPDRQLDANVEASKGDLVSTPWLDAAAEATAERAAAAVERAGGPSAAKQQAKDQQGKKKRGRPRKQPPAED